MKKFNDDFFRVTGKKKYNLFSYFKWPSSLKLIYFYRKREETTSNFKKRLFTIRLKRLSKRTHIDISKDAVIGSGFMIVHKGFLIIGSATLGKNITVSPGVVIGNEWRGKREGCPTIGNNVYIGANATIVGKIIIGDDVLIAPNTFVNFDVPSHSVVLGNPGIIKHKENATKDYQAYTV